MKISILISTYNGEKHILELLNSISRLHTDPHEIEVIIRDDNSTDRTIEKIEIDFPWVCLIKGEETLGFVGSNNVAYQYATGDIICCLNQDTIVDRDFIIEGMRVLKEIPDAVGINTNMIMPWVLTLDEFKRKKRKDIPAFEYQLTPWGFTRYVQVERIVRPTNFLSGGAFFLKRAAIEGDKYLFDSKIFMYCEDTDLSVRLTKNGKALYYAPEAIVYHNQEIKKNAIISAVQKTFRITWNRFYVAAKHDSIPVFIKNYFYYVLGIILKMGYLGLPRKKMPAAYCLGTIMAVIFIFFMPCFLWQAYVQHQAD